MEFNQQNWWFIGVWGFDRVTLNKPKFWGARSPVRAHWFGKLRSTYIVYVCILYIYILLCIYIYIYVLTYTWWILGIQLRYEPHPVGSGAPSGLFWNCTSGVSIVMVPNSWMVTISMGKSQSNSWMIFVRVPHDLGNLQIGILTIEILLVPKKLQVSMQKLVKSDSWR